MYMKNLNRQVICTYDDPVVETKQGKLRGVKIDSTYIFRGIKYADAVRFHMPTPVEPWEGIKEAYNYGYVCDELNTPIPHDQYTVPHFFYPQDEHCQYLNVWTQSLDRDAKKPVMVWLHGGGWFSGSSVELLAYDGENLSHDKDVVVVSVNHRLNVLGYLNLANYGEEYKNSVNAGLADLVESLRWVHENIENFGGDPENVTIFGQSGGGAKVLAMLQTPAADGLFHRAVMESGGPTGAGSREAAEARKQDTLDMADEVVRQLGLTKETIREIETIDWYDLADATMKAIWVMSHEKGRRVNWAPQADGEYYFGHPLDYGFRKESLHIPMMVGSVLGEFDGNFNVKIGDDKKNYWDDATKDAHLKERFGDRWQEMKDLFIKAYPDRNYADVLYTNTGLRRGCIEFTKARAAAGGRVWNWMFNLESPFNDGTVAWHNAEEPYVFRNASYIEAQYIPGVSEKLEDEVSGAWVQFAKTGDPNFPGIPEWPVVTPDHVPTMCFDAVSDVRIDHDKELMERFPAPKPMGFPGAKNMYAIFGLKPEE